MHRKTLDKIKEEVRALRRGARKPRELEELAKQLGRQLKNRGKEPTWVHPQFRDHMPLSIPSHGGKDASPAVVKTAQMAFERDIEAWEMLLDE